MPPIKNNSKKKHPSMDSSEFSRFTNGSVYSSGRGSVKNTMSRTRPQPLTIGRSQIQAGESKGEARKTKIHVFVRVQPIRPTDKKQAVQTLNNSKQRNSVVKIKARPGNNGAVSIIDTQSTTWEVQPDH